MLINKLRVVFSSVIGQLITCRVTSVRGHETGSRRVVKLSMNLGGITYQNDLQPEGINYSTLLPGMQLKGFVEECNDTGLKINSDNLISLCHSDHLTDEWTTPSTFTPAQDVKCRVLFVNPQLNTPYVTLQNDVTPLRSILKTPDSTLLGAMQQATVVAISNRGIIVRLKVNQKKGLIPLASLGDGLFTSKQDIEKKFRLRSEVECRVVKYSPFEQMYICSRKKDLVNATIIKAKDAQRGQRIECKIVKLTTGGLSVRFEAGLRGFVPRAFLPRQQWHKLKKEADKISPEKGWKGRVMYYEEEKNRLLITLHTDLVKSKGVVIGELGEAKKGQKGHALVMEVVDDGVLVKTIGGVKGWIPKRLFRKSSVYKDVDFRQVIKKTEVIAFKVVKVEADKDQLVLKPDGGEEEAGEEEQTMEVRKKGKKRKRTESEKSGTQENKEPKTKKLRKRRGKKKVVKGEGKSEKNDDEQVEVKQEGDIKQEEDDEEEVEVKIEMPEITGSFWAEEDKPEKVGLIC